MNKYEIRVIPKEDVEGKTYWTAFYPAIEGCVGGGETAEEAIREAEENLEFFLEYLKFSNVFIDCSSFIMFFSLIPFLIR